MPSPDPRSTTTLPGPNPFEIVCRKRVSTRANHKQRRAIFAVGALSYAIIDVKMQHVCNGSVCTDTSSCHDGIACVIGCGLKGGDVAPSPIKRNHDASTRRGHGIQLVIGVNPVLIFIAHETVKSAGQTLGVLFGNQNITVVIVANLSEHLHAMKSVLSKYVYGDWDRGKRKRCEITCGT